MFDLDEVTLVDSAVVRFLLACEAEGIELLHGSPYIREWMDRERARESSGNDKGAKPRPARRARLAGRRFNDAQQSLESSTMSQLQGVRVEFAGFAHPGRLTLEPGYVA